MISEAEKINSGPGKVSPSGKVTSTAASRIKAVVISATMKAILLARCIVVSILFLLCCLVLPGALKARAGSPTEQVRATVDKALTIVESA
jgi:hypothetical protein